jgi:hypothetical protein
MTGFESVRWKIRKLFPGLRSRLNSDSAVRAKAYTAIVELLAVPRRLPTTPVEQRLIATLKQAGPVSFPRLVNRVAADLYIEELGKGAGVLDIGLFGDRLFNRDVVRELEAGDGILWEIKQERKSPDDILSCRQP